MGLPYPGGPVVDKLAKEGDPGAFRFPEPKIPGLDFSFSGLKTSFLYFLRDRVKEDPEFIQKHKEDLSASIQRTIINYLMKKLKAAADEYGINEIAVAGGVSANSELRSTLLEGREKFGWNVYIPKFEYCTDNAAMVAVTAYFKFLRNEFASFDIAPYARSVF
jgi:N6-L-threonylcarbamoyladenine synthase